MHAKQEYHTTTPTLTTTLKAILTAVKPLKFQWFDYQIVKPLKFQWFDFFKKWPLDTKISSERLDGVDWIIMWV